MRMHPVFKLTLLAGAALSVSTSAMAQQIAPESSPMDDVRYATPEEAATLEEAAPRKKRGRGGDSPRVEVVPYLEVQQVLVADLKNGGDVLTYSTVAVGGDASVATRRTEAQISLRYERLIGYDNGVEDQDTLSGLARGSVALTRNFSVEAGGVAARTTVDGRGATPLNRVGNTGNVIQVYSVYAGPTFATNIGEASVNAAYKAGYTKVESQRQLGLPTGQSRLNQFDDSVSHSAVASVGIQPGTLPFGLASSVGYAREDASALDQRFEAKFSRIDATLPVSPTVAIIGGVGYEDIEISERDALRDGAGNPVFGSDGRPVTDSASPRLNAYDQDGIIWDVGVLWRPSRRTSLTATYGRRYGSDIYTGSLSYQPGREWAVNVSVYDTVTGFGSFVNESLAALPTAFRTSRNPLLGDIGGCAFGQTGGFCVGDALQNAASAAFRQRGVTASFSGTNGGWDSGFAIGYNQRRFIASRSGANAIIDGVKDDNYFAVASLGTDLDYRTRFESNVYVSYFDPGFAGAGDTLATGVNAALYRRIIRGLSASAALGLDTFNQEDFDSELTASALLGLRYSF